MDWFPQTYIMCNPQYEQERFQFLLRHFSERGLPSDKIQFIYGPWGSEIGSEQYFKAYDPFHKKFGLDRQLSFKASALSKGEVSLSLTFAKVIEECLKNVKEDSKYILVLESDVVLRPDFVSRLKEVFDKAKDLQTWDYISLGEGVGTRPPGSPMSYFGETRICKPPHQFVFRCTDSMLLSKRFMKKLQQTFLPVRECLDWELNIQMTAHKGISFWADPPLVEPATNKNRMVTSLPA